MEHWDTIAAERRRLADLLDGLTEEQWATPSLCDAWTVRDVVGHLVVPHTRLAPLYFLMDFVAAGGNFERANVRLTARQAHRSTAALTADLRRYATSHFRPPGFGSEAPLTDVLVHGADIRLPLGLGDGGAPERWRPALDLVVSPKARRGFVPRQPPALRYVATDIGWSSGAGDEVEGAAADVALAILGRRARLDALSGRGAAALAAWAAP
jgi:uncharacterized protein (TIGR03083 family)